MIRVSRDAGEHVVEVGRGIDPSDYLRDVLTRLPSATNWTVAELTPENWKKNLSSSRLAA